MPSEVENKTGHGLVDCINPLPPTGTELLEVVETAFDKFSTVRDVTLRMPCLEESAALRCGSNAGYGRRAMSSEENVKNGASRMLRKTEKKKETGSEEICRYHKPSGLCSSSRI